MKPLMYIYTIARKGKKQTDDDIIYLKDENERYSIAQNCKARLIDEFYDGGSVISIAVYNTNPNIFQYLNQRLSTFNKSELVDSYYTILEDFSIYITFINSDIPSTKLGKLKVTTVKPKRGDYFKIGEDYYVF